MWRKIRAPLLIYLASTAIYAAASGTRLRRATSDNHYVHLAETWLRGRLDLGRKPPHENDWARVEELTLRDGRTLRGVTLRTASDRFKTLAGEVVPVAPGDVRTRSYRYYVSFPPFPAVLMLPGVAIWGQAFNDVWFTVLFAGLNPMLMWLLLDRLRERTGRTRGENLWLTAMFGFGTVLFYSSVIGQVWYTAHVVGVALATLYLWASWDARHPVWAGLCVGLGFVTRTPLLFAFPFFLFEAWRTRAHARDLARRVVWFALPVAVIGLGTAWLNAERFGSPFEFGHYYLNVKWTERIQRWGLFNYHFLARNLAVMLVLLPRLYAAPPFVKVSWHGMSIFATTPALLYLLWPRRRSQWHRPLWLTVAAIALPSLLYQNSGWVQFGYRFALDFMPMLIILWALSGRPLTWLAKSLIAAGVAVNLFGAITFGRMWQFYWDGLFPVE